MSQKQPVASNPLAKAVFLFLVVLSIVIGGLYLIKKGGDTPPSRAEAPPASSPTAPPVGEESLPSSPQKASSPKPAFEALVGRWLREDGGYVIEISDVRSDGTLKAAYFNPRPIHVSRAAAVEEAGSVKVGIELNDTGYPGCLYTLIFNRELDQLQGTYFQAAQRQTYQIAFVRMPTE
jgi:hypothetical protein